MILSYKIIKFLLPWVGKICLLNHYNENITTKVVSKCTILYLRNRIWNFIKGKEKNVKIKEYFFNVLLLNKIGEKVDFEKSSNK